MNKIEELESLIMVWKAAKRAAKKTGHKNLYNSLIAKIADAKAVLGKLRKPSNTQIQSGGLVDHCKKCRYKVKHWPKFKRDCLGRISHR